MLVVGVDDQAAAAGHVAADDVDGITGEIGCYLGVLLLRNDQNSSPSESGAEVGSRNTGESSDRVALGRDRCLDIVRFGAE
jgi:hypothetical protein